MRKRLRLTDTPLNFTLRRSPYRLNLLSLFTASPSLDQATTFVSASFRGFFSYSYCQNKIPFQPPDNFV